MTKADCEILIRLAGLGNIYIICKGYSIPYKVWFEEIGELPWESITQ